MNHLIKLSLGLFLSIAAQSAFATTQPLQDCSQLQAPNTVLLVYANWCHCCTTYKPIYETVSNKPENANMIFYTKEYDFGTPICGKSIMGVPMTFSHNMQKVLKGAVSENQLVQFIQDQ